MSNFRLENVDLDVIKTEFIELGRCKSKPQAMRVLFNTSVVIRELPMNSLKAYSDYLNKLKNTLSKLLDTEKVNICSYSDASFILNKVYNDVYDTLIKAKREEYKYMNKKALCGGGIYTDAHLSLDAIAHNTTRAILKGVSL